MMQMHLEIIITSERNSTGIKALALHLANPELSSFLTLHMPSEHRQSWSLAVICAVPKQKQ